MKKLAWIAAVVLVPLAPANASDHPDPVAAQAISDADYGAAEARLERAVARGSSEPAVLINLAQVYYKTGRSADASDLYRAILARPNVQMALPDGSPAWSHDLATRGLKRTAVIAQR